MMGGVGILRASSIEIAVPRHYFPRNERDPMRLILNIIWLVLGGFLSALGWFVAGILMAITIIGIPWTWSAFMIGSFTFWPFGRDVISRRELTGRDDLGTGVLGTIGNIVWFVLCGWWLALLHVLSAVACAITIIGIPFAWQHLKLAGASLFPVGLTVVDIEVTEAARRRSAESHVTSVRQGG